MLTLSRYWLAGRRVASDAFGRRDPCIVDLAAHRAAAVAWLARAQDVAGDGGVPASFHLREGWCPSYPETTGYIAATFLHLAGLPDIPDSQAADLTARARRMINWLLTCQYDDGGFPGQFGNRSRKPIVFNTGQILFGLTAAIDAGIATPSVERAAERAVNWLIRQQDDDGCWRRCEYHDTPHTYNTRTAWALAAYGRLVDDRRALDAAAQNLRWALQRCQADGWIELCAFRPGEPPFLHTLAYAIQGFLEAGRLLGSEPAVAAAECAARRIAQDLSETGGVPGAYHPGWRPAARFRCLTGEAQMAVVWARLAAASREAELIAACDTAVRAVAATQDLTGPAETRGAIAGSSPIWGRYSRFEFPNWAAKFFIDAVTAHAALTRAAGEVRPCG